MASKSKTSKFSKIKKSPNPSANLKNNKSLGQHWLKDRQILDDIADFAAEDCSFDNTNDNIRPSPNLNQASHPKICLEIGPGLGTLTSSLLKRFEQVISVEFDPKLAANLPKSFPGKNLKVINQDFLQFDLETVATSYVVAGNIPYYITSPIITKLLEAKNPPQKIVLLIQKEVAERLAALDGKHSVLSLDAENRAAVALGPVVPKIYFTPPPKVDSQIVILTPHPPQVDENTLKLIKRGFSAPRKKLQHNLQIPKAELLPIFQSLGLSEDARPADLSLETWASLAKSLA